MLKKTMLAGSAALMLAGCTAHEQRVATGAGLGAGAGAITGALITGNARGVNALNSASVGTFGNNRLTGNPVTGAANDGAFTGTVIPSN